MRNALRPHRELIADFVSGAVTADQFETRYLAQYKADPTLWTQDLFAILDGLFFHVDDYVSDPDLRARAGGLDGPGLRARARATLRKLDEYASQADAGNTDTP
ncbi:MAG: colicin immunity domain-containing protein [Pseudonocardiales bacterium]